MDCYIALVIVIVFSSPGFNKLNPLDKSHENRYYKVIGRTSEGTYTTDAITSPTDPNEIFDFGNVSENQNHQA